MARKKREWYEGASYHVMGRGNRKCAIFAKEIKAASDEAKTTKKEKWQYRKCKGADST